MGLDMIMKLKPFLALIGDLALALIWVGQKEAKGKKNFVRKVVYDGIAIQLRNCHVQCSASFSFSSFFF
jgi:hypothetical protein